MARLRAHVTRNLVGYVALFVALGGTSYAAVRVGSGQVVNNSLRSGDIRNNDLRGKDIRNRTIRGPDIATRTLRAQHFATGQLPRGAQGAPGPRGPSFGDGRGVPNRNDIPCDTDVVLGSLTLTVASASRIWVHGQGAFRQGGSPKQEFGLRLRLRNAANTTTLATAIEAWDAKPTGDADAVMPLSTGGLLLTGESEPVTRPVFVAPPGTYVLQLVGRAISGATPCTTNLPDFGYNNGNSMGYIVIGTG